MPPTISSNGYGAVNGSARSAAALIDEEQPLLGGGRSLKSGWRKTMATDIHREWTDLVLLVCYVVTGLLDSASISTWGSFVSMQTGLFLPIAALPVEKPELTGCRQHGIYRLGNHPSPRVYQMDQVRHLSCLLLHRIGLL